MAQTGVMSESLLVKQDRRIDGKKKSHVTYKVPGCVLSFRFQFLGGKWLVVIETRVHGMYEINLDRTMRERLHSLRNCVLRKVCIPHFWKGIYPFG